MSDDRTTAEYAAFAGGAATVVGSGLPWYRAGDVTAAWLTGNDLFTLLFGLLVCWIYVAEDWHNRATLVVAAFGLLTVLVAGVSAVEIGTAIGNAPTPALWLTVGGGIVLVTAGAIGYRDERKTTSGKQTDTGG